MIEDDVNTLPSHLPELRYACELLFTRLIAIVPSPNLCFNNVFSLVVVDDEIHSATTGLYFNVHNATDNFNKLIEIREKKMSAHGLLWVSGTCRILNPARAMKSRKLSSNASISMRPVGRNIIEKFLTRTPRKVLMFQARSLSV